MSARFKLEHPVPGASSCCWPQPSLFSCSSENALGLGVWLEKGRTNYLLAIVCPLVRAEPRMGVYVAGGGVVECTEK